MGISVFPAPSAGLTQKVQVFTSTGTFTTPSNVTSVRVFLVGGGGGGGGGFYTAGFSLGGGGGGGVVVDWQLIPVTASTAYTVTIGAGGAGSTSSGTTGSNGGTSSFGSLLYAYGGGGGGSIDSAALEIYPRSLGTSGGWPRQGAQSAGGGGGANNSFMPQHANTTAFGVTGSALTSIGNPMEGGQFPTGVAQYSNFAGIGIRGYGGGGQGGVNVVTGGMWAISTHGGGTSDPNTNGTAGTANKGGGGGGGSCTASTARNGGAGGSGYALIEYWS